MPTPPAAPTPGANAPRECDIPVKPEREARNRTTGSSRRSDAGVPFVTVPSWSIGSPTLRCRLRRAVVDRARPMFIGGRSRRPAPFRVQRPLDAVDGVVDRVHRPADALHGLRGDRTLAVRTGCIARRTPRGTNILDRNPMRGRLRRRGCPVKTGFDGRSPNDAESQHPLYAAARSWCWRLDFAGVSGRHWWDGEHRFGAGRGWRDRRVLG